MVGGRAIGPAGKRERFWSKEDEMEAHVIESETAAARRPLMSQIRWTAVIAGLAVGLAVHLLLSLFGIAIGLTALEPEAGQPAGAVPMATGIWTGISMLIAAFIGGYVAARVSGLTRSTDGILHGFVAWATITVLFAYIATTAIGSIVGGTFGALGQGVSQAVGGAAQGGAGIGQQLQSLIAGTEGAEINPDDMAAVQDRLQAGDRQGAVDIMVNRMGFTEERANQVADRGMSLVGPGAGQQLREAAGATVSALTAASWWLFVGLLLSLVVGLWGGLVGARAIGKRTMGDHSAERRVPPSTYSMSH